MAELAKSSGRRAFHPFASSWMEMSPASGSTSVVDDRTVRVRSRRVLAVKGPPQERGRWVPAFLEVGQWLLWIRGDKPLSGC